MIMSEFRTNLPQVLAVSIKNIILIGEFEVKIMGKMQAWTFPQVSG
jgi:hypothetical protein